MVAWRKVEGDDSYIKISSASLVSASREIVILEPGKILPHFCEAAPRVVSEFSALAGMLWVDVLRQKCLFSMEFQVHCELINSVSDESKELLPACLNQQKGNGWSAAYKKIHGLTSALSEQFYLQMWVITTCSV